jgi:hypothetical protein
VSAAAHAQSTRRAACRCGVLIPLCLTLVITASCARHEETPVPRGKVSAEIAEKGPRLVGQPPTVALELPPRTTRALAADDTSFTTLTPFDFIADIVPGGKGWSYPYDLRQAPFALIADFDGDGRNDVALLQRSKGAGRVAVVFDDVDGPRVVVAKSWDRMTAGDAGKCGFYLTRFRAGPFRVPDFGGSGDSGRVVTLEHEGIEVSNYGKTATTYYWNGHAFESVTTGD